MEQKNMTKLTKAQAAALNAFKQALVENGGEPVAYDQAKKQLGKGLNPITIAYLVRRGALIEHKPNGPYSASLYTAP
jgi:hypothetical protein